MATCPSCGKELPGEFPFCPFCAAPLGGAQRREQRKTVTVVFCDVTGSTSLGEVTDPEALRALLAAYFERMRGIVEAHGGTVEKFIGDAVMAVFGVPVAHEDDALRACRAAVEMRDALPELGVQARIGVNTGEVVTGTAERLVTGDAVNVAARLEQAAAPGTILIGEETHLLVRSAVDAESVDPLALRGKSEPVPAFRLVAVLAEPERSHASRFVGRKRELAVIEQAWERAVAEDRCELVTIVGEPGVGKSRLVAEALAALDARVVRGRCLPYGEGITYWPVTEVIKQLAALPSDPAAAAAIRSLLGESDQATTADEIAWAFRKLLEEQAPLVTVFDDLQWGEETFFGLVEAAALLTGGVPLLLVCMARPELLERRPGWPAVLQLEPLSADESDALIRDEVSEELRDRITRAAGGNPLFISEMLAMARDRADVEVPLTLKALLAARLDQLDEPERRVLERGSVEGELFHRGAVQALAPEEPQVTARLTALVRRELVRPDRAQLPGEDAFRFRHLLIRDAAYDALPKSTRAELHERFAGWLAEHAVDLVELDEILGYHLEQAARYRQELGQPAPALAERAGERLAVAGRRALSRGDDLAARELLERALDLLRPFRVNVALELDLAAAQPTTRESAAIAEAAAERARAVGDEPREAAARALAARYSWEMDEAERRAIVAVPLLEQIDDHGSLVHVWDTLAYGVANERWRFEDYAHAAEQAIRHARLAGYPSGALFSLDMALVYGPRPADEALRMLDAVLPEESPEPRALLHRAWLLAMLGRFDEAWRIGLDAAERRRQFGGLQRGEQQLAEIATIAGDHEAAAEYLRSFCSRLEQAGERPWLSTYAARLGLALCELGQYDEAERWAELGCSLGDEGDVATQTEWRQAQARVLAHRGRHAEATALARDAVEIVERTDALNYQGYALADLAGVLWLAGAAEEATKALAEALERYERKRNLAMVAQIRPRLEALRTRTDA
jgi:class 3 adenylate cyclase